MPVNYSKYPPEWFDVIRPAILKRDGYKCVNCGVSQRAIGYRNSKTNFVECDTFMQAWAKSNGKKLIRIYLSVAHLNHDVFDSRPENLRSLCQQCHNRHDAANRALKRTLYASQVKASKK